MEPRSTTTTSSVRSDLGVVAAHVGVGEHDRRLGQAADRHDRSPSGTRSPVGQHQRAGARRRPGPPACGPSIWNAPVGMLSLSTSSTLTGPMKTYPSSRACSRAARRAPGSASRASRRTARSPRAELDGEVVGHDRAAPHVDRAVVVHLPHQPPAELDRSQPAAEHAGEGALDHPLEPRSNPFSPMRAAGYRRWCGRTGCATVRPLLGRVAELADAQDSGSCVRKDVGVQVPPRPLTHFLR